MAQDWFDQITQPSSAGPTPQAGGMQVLARGAPDQNKELDRASKRQQMDFAAQDQQRQNAEYQDKQRTQDARGGVDSVEAERTAAYLVTRVAGGLQDLARIGNAGAPSIKDATIGGTLLGNYATDEARQRTINAQRDILDAALTLGTGAAYTQEQIDAYRTSYFPQPGDAPGTIADKNIRLRRLLEAGRLKAGAAANQIDAALAAADGKAPDDSDYISAEKQPDGQWKVVYANGSTAILPDLPPLAVNVSDDDPTPPSPTPDGQPGLFGEAGRRFHMGVGDVAEGIGDTLGLITNPINAGINAVAGTNIGTDLGSAFREFTGAPDARTDDEMLASAINRGGAGALTMGGGAMAAAPYVSGGASAVTEALRAAPAIDTAAGATSGASGEYARQKGAGGFGQFIASLLGGGLAAAGGAKAAARAGRPSTPPANPLVQAGQAEGVPVNRAMIDPSLSHRVTGAEASMAGGPIVRREMGSVSSAIERGVQRLGQGGTPLDDSVAGQTVSGMSKRYIYASGKQARNMYGVAEKAAGDTKVEPKASLTAVDDVIKRLSETPEINAGEIAFLNKLRSDFTSDLSVGALRRVRTSLRKKISNGDLTFGEDEAAVLGVMDAAASDIEAGLAKAGKKKAAELFKAADGFYRDRQGFITSTIQKLVGKRNSALTDGQIFSNFRNMATPKGDLEGMARLMQTGTPEETADIAATFADALGKNNKGEFSTAYLTSQARKLPPKARVNVFGPEGAESLDNLIKLARAHEHVTGSFNNSKTGRANDYRSFVQNLLYGLGPGISVGSLSGGTATGAGVGIAAGMAANTVKLIRDAMTAKMLMNKDFSKWLLISPKTADPKVIDKHVQRLAAIAAKNPVIAQDIQAFQQTLMRAANENVASINSAAGERKREENK